MFFPRLQRTLRQGVAGALRRWAHALQQQADEAERQTSAPEAEAAPPSEPPPRRPGEPPVHWLELIQNGPPAGWLAHVQKGEAQAFERHAGEADAEAPQMAYPERDTEANRERVDRKGEASPPPASLSPGRPRPLKRTAEADESSPPPTLDKPAHLPRGAEGSGAQRSPAEREVERQTRPPLRASSIEPSAEGLQGEREKKTAGDLDRRSGRPSRAATQQASEPHETPPPSERVRTSSPASPWASPHPLRLTPTSLEPTVSEASASAPAEWGRFAAESDVRRFSSSQADQANANVQAPPATPDAPPWPRPPALPAYDVQQATPPLPTAKTVAAEPDVRSPALPPPPASPRSHHLAPTPSRDLGAESSEPTARWAALPDDAWPAFDDEARDDDSVQQRARQRRERLDREQRGLLWSA